MSTTAAQTNEEGNDEPDWEELDTEEKLEILHNKQLRTESFQQDVLKKKINELENETASLRAENEAQQEQIEHLEREIEDLGGVAEGEKSTPEKRELDLKLFLKNKARADFEGAGDGKIAWRYSDVIDQLESNGHGKVYAAQAYDAMEEVAEAEGFGMGTDAEGEKVVRVNYAELPSRDRFNEINNGNGVSKKPTTTNMT